jgi:thiol-disulfide isomerase/thioredoxin
MFMVAVLSTVLIAAGQRAPKGEKPDAEERWQEKLDKDDREAITPVIGYAAPDFPKDAEWIGSPAMTWQELKGKVVVLQTWTTKTSAGRKWPERLKESLADVASEDLVLLGLHTPEGAEKAAEFMQQKPPVIPVMVDANGEFCDKLGAYKRPVNFVIDKHGQVRYAGLNAPGLKKAVEKLSSEMYDSAATPRVKKAEPEAPKAVEFPKFSDPILSAADFRGRSAPKLGNVKWISEPANMNGRLVVIDFWATWCPPCRASIPHMSGLADQFIDDVCIIGLTDESESQVESGLKKFKIDRDAFHYALASDTSASMSRALEIEGIPHIVVISSDGIVRWQGGPQGLDAQLLRQMVEANRSILKSENNRVSSGTGKGRWASETPKTRPKK